jgi:hypothetical protein
MAKSKTTSARRPRAKAAKATPRRPLDVLRAELRELKETVRSLSAQLATLSATADSNHSLPTGHALPPGFKRVAGPADPFVRSLHDDAEIGAAGGRNTVYLNQKPRLSHS